MLTNRKFEQVLIDMSNNDPRYGDDSDTVQILDGAFGRFGVHKGGKVLVDSKRNEKFLHWMNVYWK